MSKAFAESLVGLTVLLGLAGVATLLMLFGEIAGPGRATYAVSLVVADASGLSTASRVTLNGVVVGSIRSIESDADPRGGVRIDLRIDESARVPRDVEVSLDRGLVGEATLALRTRPLAPGAADPGYVAAGETIRREARGVIDQLSALLDDKLGSFERAAEDFSALAKTLETAGDRLNEVLAPRTPADVDAGASPNLVSTVSRFDLAVRDARGWLGDGSMQGDLRASATRLRTLLDDAASAAEAVRNGAEALGDRGAAALEDVSASARALGEAAHEVQRLAARLNAGEGTAGQLVVNPDLYRSLNDAASRLERVLEETRLLVEKYRKEGVPLKF